VKCVVERFEIMMLGKVAGGIGGPQRLGTEVILTLFGQSSNLDTSSL
jgi:hypothetical protein